MGWVQKTVADMKKLNPKVDLPSSEELKRRKHNWETKEREKRKDWVRSEISEMVYEQYSFIIIDECESSWLSNGNQILIFH